MGKGDKKTKRGKITKGSYGNLRPRKWKDAVPEKPVNSKTEKAEGKTKPASDTKQKTAKAGKK